MPDVRLMLGDCLERMKEIEAGSVDLIAADLPYQVTSCGWDTLIPFAPMWAEFDRILADRGAVVLTATQPFAADLIASRRDRFKYEWIWEKSRPSDKFNVKNKPMGKHENILVFSPGTTANCSPSRMTYNPQGLLPATRKVQGTTGKRHHGTRPSHKVGYRPEFTGYPTSVLYCPSDTDPVHPTQKPVALFEYLIRTYSNEGETVLDCTMGSGTTGVACLNTGRDFIGIERDPGYFATAERRIDAARSAYPLHAE